MSLATRTLIGALLGILSGVFLGDWCAWLQPVGSVYVAMLQSVMYPVVMASIVMGLGKLSPDVSGRLFRRGWPFLALAWGLTLAVIAALARALPPAEPSLHGQPQAGSGNLLLLLVPSNPFVDLVSNFVPALVVFSVLYGLAVQRTKDKEALLRVCGVIYHGGIQIWKWVVLAAPYAVFALMAATAGTVRVRALPGLALYVALFTLGCLLLALWVLPALLSALAPVPILSTLTRFRPALTLALTTTLPLVALPYIQEAVAEDVRRAGFEDSEGVAETTVAVVYGLGQLGNVFAYLAVLFSSFYFQVPLSATDQALLPFVTVASSIGTPSASVNAMSFLGAWLGLPAEATTLYVEMMTFTRYPQVVLTVMGFYFVTLLVTLTYYGRLSLRRKALTAHVASLMAVLAGVVVLRSALRPPWEARRLTVWL